MILVWDKIARPLSTKDWKENAGFEDGPHGGYVPNMSADDRKRWKAKVTGQKLGYPQVEIRKSTLGGEMVIIVNLGAGYNYKSYRAENKPGYNPYNSTKGINVHIALNGPAQMTFADLADMQAAIAEAKERLAEMAAEKDDK